MYNANTSNCYCANCSMSALDGSMYCKNCYDDCDVHPYNKSIKSFGEAIDEDFSMVKSRLTSLELDVKRLKKELGLK